MLTTKSLQSTFIFLAIISTAIICRAQNDKKKELREMPAKVFNKVAPVCVKINYDNDLKNGSGVVVGSSHNGRAIILTACHVVASNFEIAREDPDIPVQVYRDFKVKIGESPTSVSAGVLYRRYNVANDLALIATRNPVSYKGTIRYNRSSGVKPGQKVAAFGYPESDELTQTVGVIKRLEDNFLVFDATIAPGSSGGPLVDKHGRMIGLAVSISEEVGLAVPLDLVLSIVDSWLKSMNLKNIWRRQKYTSCWQKAIKHPLYLFTEVAGIGTGLYFGFFRPGERIFGEPPGPPPTGQ
ncbi:MAG: trypsin-like peptidase domain-containing protein [bacterium]